MPSIADLMLSAGCVQLLHEAHAETVKVLSGADAGKTFRAIKEVEQDVVLTSELQQDRRPRRILRFLPSSAPNLSAQDVLQTEDGMRWNAVVMPETAYLTTDFELVAIDTTPITS
jgi:hypothetical protein